MISLEERLRELEEPPGAEMLDLDAVLRLVGYKVKLEGVHRAYYHERWGSKLTFRADWGIIPPHYVRRVNDFLRLKLKEENDR